MHYYQFNIADYRKDTVHLSPIEHYIYRYLIDWYYLDETPIPKETQQVLRRLGLGSDGLQNLQNVLKDFFKEAENGWIHGRIEREITKYSEKADISRINGKKGGRPKKQRLSEKEKPRKTQQVILDNLNEPSQKLTNNQEPITKNQEKEKNLEKKKWQRPEKVDAQAWEDFEQHRKDIREPLSDRARTKNANVLSRYPPDVQREMVDTTIRSRWTGIFPLKGGNNGANYKIPESRSAKASRIWRERNSNSEKAFRQHGSELRGTVSCEPGQSEETGNVVTVLDGEYIREED